MAHTHADSNHAGAERAVVITGHSSGIGEAAARLLTSQRWRVFGLSRSLNPSAPENLVQIETDVTDQASVDHAVSQVAGKLGPTPLRGLVNCAGAAELGLLIDSEPTALAANLAVNAVGPVRVTAGFVNLLRASDGRVVNVGSGAAHASRALNGAYPASKLALESLTKTLALELAPHGVGVSLVIPGPTASNFGASVDAALERAAKEQRQDLLAPFSAAIAKLRSADRSKHLSPEVAAEVIVAALTDNEPRSVYFAGRRAQAQWYAARATGLRRR